MIRYAEQIGKQESYLTICLTWKAYKWGLSIASFARGVGFKFGCYKNEN